ncbi:MAG: helix-turn-helix domain-containing protein [Lentisphaeria bacterium]|nr:helix-turn-helix domain-containing protein [Lentisphaeria bacterium]
MIHLPVGSALRGKERYHCHLSVFTREESFPLHDHEFYEFFLVLEGRLKHICNGETVICETGTICFLRPGDAHELHCAPDSPRTKILNCNVLGDEVQRLFLHVTSDCPVALEDCVQRILPPQAPLRQALLEEAASLSLAENDGLKTARLRMLLENILLLLIRGSGFDANPAPDWLRTARQAMHEPANYRAGLRRFVELSGRTQEHLCRAMRRYYAESPQEWLTALRLDAVFDRLMLQGGDISAAAFDAGFHNLSWFRRAFRKRYAVSPKEVRKRS